MKKEISNQDILIAEILKDIERIPKFIDPKIHLMWWREIQSIYYAFLKLIKPKFLSDYSINRINTEILNYLINLQLISDEGFFTVIQSYLLTKLTKYHKRAIELELFEAAGNMKKYFEVE